MRILADPLPVGPGGWQGCEGNGDEEGTADCQLAQDIIEAAEQAAAEEAMRILADSLPVGPGGWQGCEGNRDEEGTAD